MPQSLQVAQLIAVQHGDDGRGLVMRMHEEQEPEALSHALPFQALSPQMLQTSAHLDLRGHSADSGTWRLQRDLSCVRYAAKALLWTIFQSF